MVTKNKRKKTTLDKLQDIFVVLAGGMIMYIGALLFGIPAIEWLLLIFADIKELEMPYLFFGHVFLFFITAMLFNIIFKFGKWIINNLLSKEEIEDV